MVEIDSANRSIRSDHFSTDFGSLRGLGFWTPELDIVSHVKKGRQKRGTHGDYVCADATELGGESVKTRATKEVATKDGPPSRIAYGEWMGLGIT